MGGGWKVKGSGGYSTLFARVTQLEFSGNSRAAFDSISSVQLIAVASRNPISTIWFEIAASAARL